MSKVFVISMENKTGLERREKLNYDYEWFKATDTPLDFIKDKMIHFWNAGEKCRKGKLGAFDSHYRLYKKIYDEKINNVIILEDDCFLKKLPDIMPKGLCFLNGRFINHNNFKETNTFCKDVGINTIDYDRFRITGMWGISIEKYTDVKDFLDLIENSKRLRAIDVMLYSNKIINKYIYPSVYYNDDNGTSNIQKNRSAMYNNYIKVKKII